MRLAREFNRPDWRAMLAGMTSTELREWSVFYQDHYFQDSLIDAHFAKLSHMMISLKCKTDMTPASFSLLHPPVPDIDPSDEQLMSLAESISGGVRYVPVSG